MLLCSGGGTNGVHEADLFLLEVLCEPHKSDGQHLRGWVGGRFVGIAVQEKRKGVRKTGGWHGWHRK